VQPPSLPPSLPPQLHEDRKQRKWTLRKLAATEGATAGMSASELQAYDADYEQFMQELDGDKDMRSKLNLYKNQESAASNNKKKAAAAAASRRAGGGMDVEGAGASH
jgi:hypothetical protein